MGLDEFVRKWLIRKWPSPMHAHFAEKWKI
jgi:hypothetical protein